MKMSFGSFTDKLANDYYISSKITEGEFKSDLLAHYGVQGHPKADKCYALAYSYGHAYSFSEIASYFSELLELIKDDPAQPTEPITVYVVFKNSDMTEGRGPMVLHGNMCYANREDAAEFVDGQTGVMGFREKWSEKPGDWRIEEFKLIPKQPKKLNWLPTFTFFFKKGVVHVLQGKDQQSAFYSLGKGFSMSDVDFVSRGDDRARWVFNQGQWVEVPADVNTHQWIP